MPGCEHCSDLNGKHFKVSEMEIGKNAPPLHPNCRCSIAPYEDSAEYDEWLENLENGGTTEEWEKQKAVEKADESGIINTERGMANGTRNSRSYILNNDEIKYILSEAEAIDIPVEMLKFNYGTRTGYVEYSDVIHIKGDILPDEDSPIARDRLTVRAVLAHEYYGHRANSPSEYDINDWRDEFRASYDAAVNAPNLSDRERADLMVDAYDRARENNQIIEYDEVARRIIYGY
jgi:hypothetical protein